MGRAALVLVNDGLREKATDWCRKAPTGTRVEFKAPRRTLPQNARFWATMSDIATQVEWHGMKLSTADWRLIFLDALNREMRLVPNIDGTGYVNLGRSSSELSKEEMAAVLELAMAFGAQHGVTFHDAPPIQDHQRERVA